MWSESLLGEKPGQLAPRGINPQRCALRSRVSVFGAFQQGSGLHEVVFLQLVQDLTFDLSVRDSK